MPEAESWSQATRISTFINQIDDKVTDSIDLRFLKQDDDLLIRCHIRRLPLHQRMSGVIWLREHFELFLQPHAGGPGMVQIGLASDGEYEVVWHGCRDPDGYQISAVATITDDGWLAELHVPLAPLARAAGWSADLASAPWTYFAACIIPAEFLEWTEWQASGHDKTGLVADPRFLNSAGRDFQLLPDSPAHSFRAFSSPPGMDLHHV